jgi:hypothetical protein
MYFNKIPLIYYNFNIGDEEVLKPMRDITHNVRFRKRVLENITLFDEYDIQDGETPEIIADKVYGSSEYHWVIMLSNQRYDYQTEWPMSESVLRQYISEKYQNPYATRHYVNADGLIVMSDAPGAKPVSYYEYETGLNESKRRIKLISPQLLGQVLSEYKIV